MLSLMALGIEVGFSLAMATALGTICLQRIKARPIEVAAWLVTGIRL
jgi:hypothetical protein